MNVHRPVFAIALAIVAGGCGDDVGTHKTTPTPTPTPFQLTLRATITETGWAMGAEANVAFDGPLLLVPLGAGGLALYDVSVPAQPQRITTLGLDVLNGQAGSVASVSGRAFVATADKGGLVELDLGTPKSPRILSRFGSDIQLISQVLLRGRLLFVQSASSAGRLGGVYAFDVTASPPTLVGKYLVDLADPGFDATADGRAYLARPTGIDIFYLPNPEVRFLTTWAMPGPGNLYGISVQADRVYCAAYWGGVIVLSGARTAQPTTEAVFDWADASTYAARVAAAPPYVFVARGQSARPPDVVQVFRPAGRTLTSVWEQEASLPIVSLAVSENLLAVVELESPQVRDPRKRVALYGISGD